MSGLKIKPQKNPDFLSVGIVLMAVLALFPTPVGAQTFTDLFNTEAFSGSWEILTKMNFVGMIIQGAISVFSLLGMAMIIMRYLITLLYLSNKTLFDTIDDIKGQGKNQKFFGFGGMTKSIANANYGVGLDSIVSFFLMLLPNIKEYSDYSSENSAKYNLQETDTMTMYVLKTALPTIMAIFIFSMGWNGVLWKAYANVADGLGTAAQAFVDTRLSTYVDRMVNSGSNPKFGYSADGTEYGKFKQAVAKSLYNKVISKTTDLSSDKKLFIGQKVDEWVEQNVDKMSKEALKKADPEGWEIDTTGLKGQDKKDKEAAEEAAKLEEQAKNLEYSVIVNKTEKYTNATSISPSAIGLDENKGLYVHVFITKKKNSNETNYFEVVESGKGSKSSKDDSDSPTKTQLDK